MNSSPANNGLRRGGARRIRETGFLRPIFCLANFYWGCRIMYICPFLYLMSLASQSVTGCALGHKHFTVCLFVVLGFLCASSLSLNPYGWGWRPSMLMQLGGGCLFASPPSFPSGEGLGFSFPSTAGLCTVLYDSVLFARIRIHDLSIRESHPSTHGYRGRGWWYWPGSLRTEFRVNYLHDTG